MSAFSLKKALKIHWLISIFKERAWQTHGWCIVAIPEWGRQCGVTKKSHKLISQTCILSCSASKQGTRISQQVSLIFVFRFYVACSVNTEIVWIKYESIVWTLTKYCLGTGDTEHHIFWFAQNSQLILFARTPFACNNQTLIFVFSAILLIQLWCSSSITKKRTA